MSGMIVGLLAVIGFSCILTEAKPNQPLPEYDPTFSTVCDSFKPEASFAQVLGSGYVAQLDWATSRCLTQYNQRINTRAYTITYHYDNNGRLESYPPVIEIENPLKHGQIQTVTAYPNGTYAAVESTVIAGYLGGYLGFRGYAMVTCGSEPIQQIALVVKDKPPQSDVVEELKRQLAAIGLQGIPLNVITHNSTCVYFKPK